MYRFSVFVLVFLMATSFGYAADSHSLWTEAEQLELAGQHATAQQRADSAFTVGVSTFSGRRLNTLVQARTAENTPLDEARKYLTGDILTMTSSIGADSLDAQWWAWRGFMYATVGEYPLAIRDFRRALDIADTLHVELATYLGVDLCPVQLCYALALWQSGDLNNARMALVEEAQQSPDSGLHLFYLDQLDYTTGHQDAVVKRWRQKAKDSDHTGLPDEKSMIGDMMTLDSFLMGHFPWQPPLNREWEYCWMIIASKH